MVIDVHYHFMRLPADETAARTNIGHFLEDGARMGVHASLDAVYPAYRDIMDDAEGDKLVKRMVASGIDVTVICMMDNVDFGLPDERIMRANELCAKAAAKHPGKLFSLAGIDPRRPGAPALLRRCLTEFKMNGLKWHPDNGYYPNSKEAYAVLQVLNEFKLPLLTHCSPLPGSKAKFAQPIHLDDVAADFPNIEIIAAHAGLLWWRDWMALAQFKKNLSGDMAMWQLTAVARPGVFRRTLRDILDNIGPGQLLFSTDGPCFEPVVDNRRYVDLMKALTVKGADGIVFTPEEVNAILGGNAARIFDVK